MTWRRLQEDEEVGLDKNEVQKRSKAFAIAAIEFCERLPKSGAAGVISRQLLRSATSVGANYRSACHSKSKADFKCKMGTVAEEADESQYWMELLIESGVYKGEAVAALAKEAFELASIAVASINTARRRQENHKSQITNRK